MGNLRQGKELPGVLIGTTPNGNLYRNEAPLLSCQLRAAAEMLIRPLADSISNQILSKGEVIKNGVARLRDLTVLSPFGEIEITNPDPNDPEDIDLPGISFRNNDFGPQVDTAAAVRLAVLGLNGFQTKTDPRQNKEYEDLLRIHRKPPIRQE